MDVEKLRTQAKFRNDFVDALLECSSISNAAKRKHIISQLSKDIRFNISEHNDVGARVEVAEIVERCLDYDGGIESLIENIETIDGKSIPLRKVKQLLTPQDASTTSEQSQQNPAVHNQTMQPHRPKDRENSDHKTDQPINPEPRNTEHPKNDLDLSPDTRPSFWIQLIQQENIFRLKYGLGQSYKTAHIIPLPKTENLFYNTNNPSSENLFRQGLNLYQHTLIHVADGGLTTLDHRDGRLCVLVDSLTSDLPWEALASPTHGFVERYLSHPIVRKLRESNEEPQLLHLEKPRIGFLCAGNDLGYQNAITTAVPEQLRDQEIYIETLNANQGWDALLDELYKKQPAILHIVANGLGIEGFTNSHEPLTADGINHLATFLRKLPFVKLLLLCSDQNTDLMRNHYAWVERLGEESGLASIVLIPSQPKNSLALLFTHLLYKSLWRGHSLDEAVAAARTRLHLESFENPNQGRLPMTYEINHTLNPMSDWLVDLKAHLSPPPISIEYAEELINAGYEIQKRLGEINDLMLHAQPSKAKLIYRSESIKQTIKKFRATLDMLDQGYELSNQLWLELLLDKTSYGIAELTRLIDTIQTNQLLKPTMLKRSIEKWQQVVQVLDKFPD